MNWLFRQYGLRWPRHVILIVILLDALYIIVGLLILLGVYDWAGKRDEADRAQTRAERSEKHLAHCMNGGTFTVDAHDALKCAYAILEEAEKYAK